MEWRVVNAAQYGAAQRRRRVFILHIVMILCTEMWKKAVSIGYHWVLWIYGQGVPDTENGKLSEAAVSNDIVDVSDKFVFEFANAGYMREGKIYTAKVVEKEETPTELREILQTNVDEKYYIPENKKEKWEYLKGAKKYREHPRMGISTYSQRERSRFRIF